MYNVKAAKKSVYKTTKEDTSRNMKSLDVNENGVSLTKPAFRTNSRKLSRYRRQEEISPQHQEHVEYIHNSWLLFSTETPEECTPSASTGDHSDNQTMYYKDEPCPKLKDFKPFELELWWGRRLYNVLTKSTKKT